MLWRGSNMSILHLICVATQVLMKKLTQRLFAMLLRQKKEEQLSLMSTHLTQMSSFCSSEDIHSFPRKLHLWTGHGTQQRRIQIKKIYDELGPARAAALPGFHAFTGADITGSFAGKGKLQC